MGLTPAQARVYLALAALKKATARQISNQSGIAREPIYRLLAELEETGLIERILASPTEFKAVPIEQGLSILIKRKEKEISEIKKETSKILEDLRQNNTKKTMDEATSQFAFTPGKEAVILRMKKMFRNAEKTMDMVVEGSSFGRAMFEMFEVASEALRRGVKMRVIVADPREKNFWREAVQELTKSPSFELKTLNVKHSSVFGIFDKKEVSIMCFSKKDFADSPALWSNNANLVEVFQKYFESMWKKATWEKPAEDTFK